MNKTKTIFIMLAGVGALVAICGCSDEGNGQGGSFAWYSVSVHYAIKGKPGQGGQVLYFVALQDHPTGVIHKAVESKLSGSPAARLAATFCSLTTWSSGFR